MVAWVSAPDWTDQTAQVLHDALVEGFPRSADARPVWLAAGLPEASQFWELSAYALWRALVRDAAAEHRLEALIRAARERRPALASRLDRVLAAQLDAALWCEAEKPYEARLVGPGNRHALLDRYGLRHNLELVAQEAYPVLSITGEPGTGGSHSARLLKHVAERLHVELVTLDARDELPDPAHAIDLVRMLAKALDMSQQFSPDPNTHPTRVARELALEFVGRYKREIPQEKDRWFWIDSLDLPHVGADVREAVGHLAQRIARELPRTRQIVAGHNGDFAADVLDDLREERIGQIDDAEITGFFRDIGSPCGGGGGWPASARARGQFGCPRTVRGRDVSAAAARPQPSAERDAPAAEGAVPAAEQLRLQAAVLSHFEIPWLGGTAEGGAPGTAAVGELLADSDRVTGPDGVRHWALPESLRREVLATHGYDAARAAWRAVKHRPDDAVQGIVDWYFERDAPSVADLRELEGARLRTLDATPVRWLDEAARPGAVSAADVSTAVERQALLDALRVLVAPAFVGRRPQLDALRAQLGGPSRVTRFHGIGGIGKSAVLARHALDAAADGGIEAAGEVDRNVVGVRLKELLDAGTLGDEDLEEIQQTYHSETDAAYANSGSSSVSWSSGDDADTDDTDTDTAAEPEAGAT